MISLSVVVVDHTRVILKDSDGAPGSDYINANRICPEEDLPPALVAPLGGGGARVDSGDNRTAAGLIFSSSSSSGVDGRLKKSYIATQGCLPATRADFWQMVWQEGTRIVVMTTKEVERGKPKCARYWPDQVKAAPEAFGKFQLRTLSETSNQDYTLREFSVRKALEGGEDRWTPERRVFHYHFQAWPDHGVPNDPGCVLNFLHDVNKMQESLQQEPASSKPSSSQPSPVVVHCSAGIGRTGTFIVVDMIIDQIKRHGFDCEIDIQRTVQMVRES